MKQPALPYWWDEFSKEKKRDYIISRIDWYVSATKGSTVVRFKSSMLTYADFYARLLQQQEV